MIRSLINYFIGILSGTFVNSIVFILLAKKFDDTTFGVLNLLYTLFLFLNLVYVWGFMNLITVKDDNQHSDSLVSYVQKLSIFNTIKNIFLSLLLFLTFDLFHKSFFENIAREIILYPFILIAICSFVFSLSALNNAYFKKKNKSKDYLRSNLLSNLLYLLFILFFWSKLDLNIFFIALILKYLIIVFYHPRLHKIPSLLPRFTDFFSKINKALPFFIVSISMTIIDFSDNFFLAVFSTMEKVGYYGLIYKFGFFFNTFIMAFFFLFDPLSMKIRNESIMKHLPKAVLGIIILGLVYYFFVRFVLDLSFVESYFGSKLNQVMNFKYIVLIYIIYAINGYLMVVFYKDEHKLYAWVNGIAVIINILLNFYLIPKYEVQGAILSTIITYLIQLIIILFVIKNKLGLSIIKK